MDAIDDLIKLLSRLPGVGGKSAARMTYRLIGTDPNYNKRLGEAIATLQDRIHKCPICGSFTEIDPCPICQDERRDRSIICVVEQSQDVITIQNSGAYTGLFHVLGGAISPLNSIGPDQLTFSSLRKRIEEGSFKEIIIATNPNEEGDITALYIKRMFKDRDIKITRLAAGLPVGGDLEYADRKTLEISLKARMDV
ncbi:MAG: recombination protein RecR [Spirochaetales bacterium]|nr:recombination protein RecR [Spirochaetales bacterium]